MIHVTGEIQNGVQACSRCGAVIVDRPFDFIRPRGTSSPFYPPGTRLEAVKLPSGLEYFIPPTAIDSLSDCRARAPETTT